MEGQRRLDKVVVNSQFDINATLDSIRFYWNLAHHRGEHVVVEIWAEKPEPKGVQSAPKTPKGYVFQEEKQETETEAS